MQGSRERRQLLFLIVASLFLVFDGPLTGSTVEAATASPGTDSVFDAAAVAVVVGRINSTLPDRDIERIAAAVERYSFKYGLDAELVTAILVVESSARPWARSPKGAVGLMQVMPHMILPLGLAGNASTIESNVEAGCWILHNNIRRLGEDRGISAYFWGSDIRGLSYLEKVREARAELRRQRTS
ncbi:MAG: transglycosylase SLT domain-containing protein [Deltaproteobacteria bacterium]|nr:transglycosylase SLT domain-containing protein [Deltaproteobacteria bacterium]MBW2420676.1 transglycosylase SLT domain-containing protein [Deltaproteobacteria bacterium]